VSLSVLSLRTFVYSRFSGVLSQVLSVALAGGYVTFS